MRQLREVYDEAAIERDRADLPAWKWKERERFLAQVTKARWQHLLDIGAGTGVHGRFFQGAGLEVVCIDLSPASVALCRAKGLEAYVMDFLHLDFEPASFDAAFAMNSLLHVPPPDLPEVLRRIADLLRPEGLFYWGQYGGIEQAGIYEDDKYEPKRYFSLLTDGQIASYAGASFDLVEFRTLAVDAGEGIHYQSLTLMNRRN